jgi:phosphatidylinositol alpha-mannosyltransferase
MTVIPTPETQTCERRLRQRLKTRVGKSVVKIGLVSPYDWSYPGGVKNHITQLAAQLRARGHCVRILTPATGAPARRVEYGIYKLGWAAPLSVNGSVARVAVAPDVYGRIGDLLERERFDIVHLHEPLASLLPLTLLHHARRTGAAYVGTFHASVRRGRVSTPPEWAYASARSLLRPYFQRLRGRIAVSDAALQFVQRFFPADYRIIPNGVHVARFRESAPLPAYQDGKRNILFVGRIEKRKGLKHLLRAIPLVREHAPDTRFIIVGDGPLRPAYQSLVARAGWPDVVFVGRVSDAELPAYYASADLFCAPNIGSESQGIVLLEALSAGVPTIASDIPGYRTVIRDGIDGLLVPPTDHVALAQAIGHLLDSPAERLRLRTLGRLRAEVYSWEHIAVHVETYYQELLAERQPGPPDLPDISSAAAEALANGLSVDDFGG